MCIALWCVHVVDINLIILSVYKVQCMGAFPSKEDGPEVANIFYMLVKLIRDHRVAPGKLNQPFFIIVIISHCIANLSKLGVY